MTDGDSAADAERRRPAAADDGVAPWRRWGPYLSERQWGTVREDCSADGDAWSYSGWTGLVAAATTLFHTLTADEWHRGDRDSLRPKSGGDREELLP
ncbi:hypothetical protein [Streptomyces sp. NPDC058295]|uniref:hypothetical protein n=1 Tax=Streptomyces sp. NPDC058295 TaxID=3346431 RepID=UPI0036E2516C